MILTRDELDAMMCQNKDKDHECDDKEELFITPDCHEGAPMYVLYVKEEGCINLVCLECEEVFACIQIAYNN